MPSCQLGIHRRNNRRDRRRLSQQYAPQLSGCISKSKKFHVLGSPLFTRMQDLARVFKNFLLAPNTQSSLWLGAGRRRPGVRTQTLAPLNFSAVVAPPVGIVLSFFSIELSRQTPNESKEGVTEDESSSIICLLGHVLYGTSPPILGRPTSKRLVYGTLHFRVNSRGAACARTGIITKIYWHLAQYNTSVLKQLLSICKATSAILLRQA